MVSMRIVLFFMGVMAVARCVFAEPLAYWRLDVLQEGLDLRNAAGTNHFFELHNGSLSASFRTPLAVMPQWEQLPETTRGGRYNKGSVFIEGAGHAFLCAPYLGSHLELTHSFTVEGWLRKAAEPARGLWCPVFGAGQVGAGWGLGLLNEDGKTKFHLRVDCPFDKQVWSRCFSALEVTGDYDWLHVALVYDVAAARFGTWELFVDSTSCGVVTNAVKPSGSQEFAGFYLGGCAGDKGTFLGQVDLWRVSDEALPAARFLSVSPSSTVAYWPLDTATDGKLDLDNRAGAGYALLPGKDGGVSGSAEQAVPKLRGQPSARQGKRDVRSNVGSVRFEGGLGQRSFLVAPELGLRCDLTNSFTVEGWFLKKGNPDERSWCLAGVRDDSNGWMLSLRPEHGRVRFHLRVSDVSQGGRLQVEQAFQNTDMSEQSGWHHVALVYDHRRDGYGVWSLYLDGVPQGEIRNPVAPDRSHGRRDFMLGGRVSLSNSYVGGMDCWRVSDTPLAPEQFLCHVPDSEARPDQPSAAVPRHVAYGTTVPIEGVCGQPVLSMLRDGNWVCVATGSPRNGKGMARQVISTASADQGNTWATPVDIVSIKATNALFSTCLVTPFDRIYAFYVDEGRSGTSNSVCEFTFSDDGGLIWSPERHRIPLAPPGAGARRINGFSKPVVSDGTAYVAFTAQTQTIDASDDNEGWVIVSDNILSERNASRVRFKVLPDGGNGIRNPAFGSVQTGHHLIALGGKALACAYCAESLPAPALTVSRDGGCVWSVPERMIYGPDRRMVKDNGAGVRVFGLGDGRFTMCYSMPVLSQRHGGAPVFIAGGVRNDAGLIRWSEPELLMYDRCGTDAPTCEDMVEQDGRFWVMLEQAGMLRTREVDSGLLQGLWQQETRREVCSNGLAVACLNPSGTELSFAVPPTFGNLDGGGLSVELWVTPEHTTWGETLFSTRKGLRGVRVGTASSKGLLTMRIELYDGNRQVVWHTDPGALQKDRLHHVVFVCDAVAGLVGGIIDGIYCDGGEKRAYGWAEIPMALCTVAAADQAKVSASVKQIRLYDRALSTSEAVGNFRAGPCLSCQ